MSVISWFFFFLQHGTVKVCARTVYATHAVHIHQPFPSLSPKIQGNPGVVGEAACRKLNFFGSGLKRSLWVRCTLPLHIRDLVILKLLTKVAGDFAVSSSRLTQKCSPAGGKTGCFILQSEDVHRLNLLLKSSKYLSQWFLSGSLFYEYFHEAAKWPPPRRGGVRWRKCRPAGCWAEVEDTEMSPLWLPQPWEE